MSNDELAFLAISSLTSLVRSGSLTFPTTSLSLLAKVITTKPNELSSSSSVPNKNIRFKLTDKSRFDGILEGLSHTWERGTISLTREANGEITVLDVVLDPPGHMRYATADGMPSADTTTSATNSIAATLRKRKRVIDEDADSAAGDDDAEETFYEELGLQSTSVLESLDTSMRETYAILQKSTARGRLLAEQFRSTTEKFEPICPYITKDDCSKARSYGASGSTTSHSICDRVHFRILIRPHTDVSLGHCSYLNTCYSEPTYSQSPSIPPFPGSVHATSLNHNSGINVRGPVSLPSGLGAGGRGKEKAPCRYLHFEVDWDEGDGARSSSGSRRGEVNHNQNKRIHKLGIGQGPSGKLETILPPQWINCDLRHFDYSVLGKFHVIMADPPWDIHMSLPYGTMTDDEMRAMPIPTLQDEGLLFLWVTGRAMEVGRECMRVWGYTRIDEVIWVKTNQLQRVIRTGRTGHWLNHTKEHMLVGIKTVIDPSTGALKYPSWVNRGLNTDVIVSEVRETSRKPEEVYGMIERMCPGGRKIEVFGRRHNTRPGWLTLGNQLGTDQIYEEDLAARIKARYPERNITTLTNL